MQRVMLEYSRYGRPEHQPLYRCDNEQDVRDAYDRLGFMCDDKEGAIKYVLENNTFPILMFGPSDYWGKTRFYQHVWTKREGEEVTREEDITGPAYVVVA